ncbi:hypothetical protein LOAG_03910 [Loa loa]|uniref:Uncharacterized protein n=1 Tax=Loa loa TaxID=7209 RepID=A0A1S0U319_LOALO|nr:hypothetical protein LOAG_03910 [Loa loa]EFO24573.1 hypothetical protein LOAG_03910 [Loa loa]
MRSLWRSSVGLRRLTGSVRAWITIYSGLRRRSITSHELDGRYTYVGDVTSKLLVIYERKEIPDLVRPLRTVPRSSLLQEAKSPEYQNYFTNEFQRGWWDRGYWALSRIPIRETLTIPQTNK